MESLRNASNLPLGGFREVAEIARAVPAFEIRCSDFGELAVPLDGVLRLSGDLRIAPDEISGEAELSVAGLEAYGIALGTLRATSV